MAVCANGSEEDIRFAARRNRFGARGGLALRARQLPFPLMSGGPLLAAICC